MEQKDLQPDPFEQFTLWFREAEKNSGLRYPNAMAVATVDPSGQPSVRMVLLKSYTPAGLVFFTNYGSRKGRELGFNPQAALCFYWDALERQVRVEGKVERLTPEESSVYFHTRPRLSQLGAWASPQSEEIPSREFLAQRVAELDKKYAGQEVPLPDFWGGLRLVPSRYEFWQLGQGRLHDRFVYEQETDTGQWRLFRLAP